MADPRELTAFVRGLRSVRRFDAARPIPDDVLHEILETGRWTGSAKNVQPWRLVVVRDRERLAAIAGLGEFAGHVAGATLAIVVLLDQRRRSRMFDEGRIAQNLQLAAWAHGVGSCIATIFPEANEDALCAWLGAPAGTSARSVLSLGYPADVAATRVDEPLRSRIPLGRLPLDVVVGEERYPDGGQEA